ncbi:MAG: hypothetical protein OHK0015_44330 [Chloroflexi bacterium OHK40]
MDRPTRFRTIIVALDGTPETEQIIAPARELATVYGAKLVLVRAFEPHSLPPKDDLIPGPNVPLPSGPAANSISGLQLPVTGTVPGDDFALAQPLADYDAAGYLNILGNELQAAGFDVEHVDPADDPAEAILGEARARDAGLVVMGTRQRRGWERFFKGSTAEKVLRESPCPVLAIPID